MNTKARENNLSKSILPKQHSGGTTRAILVVGGLILFSILYLSELISILQSSLDPVCAQKKESISISVWYLDEILISCKALTLNEVGDYFAGLVSLLATMWLVVAFIWQALELSFQRKEFQETNRIALTRAANEDVWRTIEYYEQLRIKLGRTVNEALAMEAQLLGKSKPVLIEVTTDLITSAKSKTEKFNRDNFDEARHLDVSRYNDLTDTNVRIVKAITEIEKDPAFEKYIALIR